MSMRQKCLNSADRRRDLSGTVQGALAQHGQGKGETLAAEVGKTPRTLLRYMGGANLPDMVTGLLLMERLPDEFTARLLLSIGMAGAFRIGGGCPPAEVLREVVEGAAALAAAWVDQRIDHTEWPRVRDELATAMVCIARFLAAEGAPA